MKKYFCYSDGFCTDNGESTAKAGGSYAVYDGTQFESEPSHEHLKHLPTLHHEHRFNLQTCGTKATNNVAEAQALLQLTTYLVSQSLLTPESKVVIFMDSDLIMKQVLGVYKVRDQHIKRVLVNLYTVFRRWETKHKPIKIQDHLEFRWIPGVVMKTSIIGH